MSELVFFLEESSAAEMLKGFLPKVLPEGIEPVLVSFEGKQDLERELPKKLRGWTKPCLGFVVLRDKDGGDCLAIKQNIRDICTSCDRPEVLIRIACHELESWYLGQLSAVDAALNTSLASLQNKSKYRETDRLSNASDELYRITNKKYKKVSGSREIGKHLSPDPSNTSSHSFRVFVSGIRRILAS